MENVRYENGFDHVWYNVLSEDKQASEKTYILPLHVYIWYIKIYSCDFIHLALGYESDAFDVK